MASIASSVGGVLMLSQVSWRISCAFTAARGGAPAPFLEVEKELKVLTNTITSLASKLDEDAGMLDECELRTKTGISNILGSCSQTLENLNSFVGQYQEVRKFEDSGSLIASRQWRPILVRNWKTIAWTTNGGSILSLRNLLAIHAQSMALVIIAIQSESVSRLEHVVDPVASRLETLHNPADGEIDDKIVEVHRVMLSLKAELESAPDSPTRPESIVTLPPVTPSINGKNHESYGIMSSRKQDISGVGSSKSDSSHKTPELTDSELSSSPRGLQGASEGSTSAQRLSDLMAADMQYSLPLSSSRSEKSQRRWSSRASEFELPDPAISLATARLSEMVFSSVPSTPLTPRLRTIESDGGHSYLLPDSYEASLITTHGQLTTPAVVPATVVEQKLFERKLFTNATTLCEVTALSVDYTQPDEDNKGDWVMKNACSECKVCIVTKQEKSSTGIVRFQTSIWALSTDRTVRLQQPIPDGIEVVPYTVWGSETKVVIRFESELKFNDVVEDDEPNMVAKTAWVNYVFEDEGDAAAFQGALLGKSLLLSVKLKRVMRIHEGITGTFAFAEQICGLENLRIFQDPSSGGALAMIHYSPAVHDGYMIFYLNSAQQTIRVKDEDEKTIRVKGLKIHFGEKLVRSNSLGVKMVKVKTEKPITGAKIEFYTVADRMKFMVKLKEVQRFMI